MGILGLGRIGSRVAAIAGAMGMTVLYHDLLEIPEAKRHGATPVSRERLLAEADVLSIHVDPRPANHRIVSTDLVSQLKETVIVINTARGVLVDSKALAAFLWANPRATALIDVHDPEPFGPDYPLLGLKNANISPHLAAATAAAHENMSWVVRDVVRVLRGEQPEFPAPVAT
jgi:phosphoglycerate dehydrogenase-like enzyme